MMPTLRLASRSKYDTMNMISPFTTPLPRPMLSSANW